MKIYGYLHNFFFVRLKLLPNKSLIHKKEKKDRYVTSD